ncbi:MAG: InlB B-repeat-containing protein, partial [Clostridia bacterium]|nr:InlB B-repeat-containing protein [Clostridia bacterium]
VDKAEHAWGEPVVVTPATATQDGSKTYTCSVCGYVKTEAIQVLTSYPVELWGYEDGENRLLFSDHVAHGADYVFYHEPEERDGYDFVGWELASHDDETDAYTISFADVQLHTRQGKLIVNALYQQVYEVTFVDYNDGIFARAKVEAGDCVQAPQQEPARYGYDFDGWDFDFDTPITQDTAISALYTRLYQVTFCDQDGQALETKQVREGDAASYEAPELGGYEFEYWTDGTVDDQNVLVDAAQALAAVTDDLTVTAYYRVVGFTVRFFAKGNLLEEQIVNPCGFAIEPELPAQYQYAIDWDEYAGYAFSGWDTEFDLVTKDLDVTAQYETPIDEDTPIIAVKTDRYKEIVAEEISGALSINVSFVLIYDHDVRGLTIRVSQDSSLLVYSGYTLFPETQSFAQDNVEASISKDEVGDDVRYLEDVTWSSGSGSAIEIDEKKEILRIVYQINGVDAAKNEGDYWIMINDNTFIVNDELVRVTPIVISDFVRIVAQADELESIEE